MRRIALVRGICPIGSDDNYSIYEFKIWLRRNRSVYSFGSGPGGIIKFNRVRSLPSLPRHWIVVLYSSATFFGMTNHYGVHVLKTQSPVTPTGALGNGNGATPAAASASTGTGK